jgi:hypothetical protein
MDIASEYVRRVLHLRATGQHLPLQEVQAERAATPAEDAGDPPHGDTPEAAVLPAHLELKALRLAARMTQEQAALETKWGRRSNAERISKFERGACQLSASDVDRLKSIYQLEIKFREKKALPRGGT